MSTTDARRPEAGIGIVVDASGSTLDVRSAIARLVSQLIAELAPTPCTTYAWGSSLTIVEPTGLDQMPDSIPCSWEELAAFLDTTKEPVVLVTDACLSHEQDVIAVRRAEAAVKARDERGVATHVLLIGDSPDELVGVRLQSGARPPFSAEQVLRVAGALRGHG
jgi:hypothetical protein